MRIYSEDIFWGTFGNEITSFCDFCTCANDSFWNLVRLYRPFWYFKPTSYFLRLDSWFKTLKLSKVYLLDKRGFSTSLSIFDNVMKNWFLVCKLHISHMIQQMISIVIISQVVSLVQISSSYYIYKLRYWSGDGKKMCTLEGLVKIRGEYLFSTKALNIPLSKMFKLKGWITIFRNRNCDIVYQLCTAVPSL